MKYYFTSYVKRTNTKSQSKGIYIPRRWGLEANCEVDVEVWCADETVDATHYFARLKTRAANKTGGMKITLPPSIPLPVGEIVTVALTPRYKPSRFELEGELDEALTEDTDDS